MVAIIKPRRKPKIYTGKTQSEELAEDFKLEITGMLKQVAKDYHCNVEELKYTVNNVGVVNIQRMTPEEMVEMENRRQHNKRVNVILKRKGLYNV